MTSTVARAIITNDAIMIPSTAPPAAAPTATATIATAAAAVTAAPEPTARPPASASRPSTPERRALAAPTWRSQSASRPASAISGAPSTTSTIRVESAARAGRLVAARPARDEGGRERRRDATDEQRGGDHQPGHREDQRRGDDGDKPGQQRDGRRGDGAQVEVLHAVGVGDEAREQIRPVWDRARDQLHQTGEEARSQVGEGAEGEVVGDEALRVAQQRARDPEEAHADDRHAEQEDLRPLGGARDQPPRDREQRAGGEHGCRAENDRQTRARPALAG